MGPLGWQETIAIFILALLVFGPKKLPELGKTVAKAMNEFRRASTELKSTWNREMQSIEKENQELTAETRKIGNEITSAYNDSSTDHDYDSEYDYEYEDSYDYGTDTASDSASDNTSTVGASENQGAESTATETAENNAPEGTVPATESTVATSETPSTSTDTGSEEQPAAAGLIHQLRFIGIDLGDHFDGNHLRFYTVAFCQSKA